MTDMELLKAAQDYTEARGDDFYWFCEVYTRFREELAVRDSVYRALYAVYGEDCPSLKTLNSLVDKG